MPAPLDADQLRTFVAIVETGSFTRAAEAVNKTQSAVSMQMKRLEERIGRPLFERDGRQSRLTDDGGRLLDYARRIVLLSDEALAIFSRAALEGRVCLGTPDDYADRFLPEILSSFTRSNPLVEVMVLCEPSFMLFERIRARDVDLAIVTHADGRGVRWPDGNLDPQTVFRREPLLWVTSERHCAHTEKPVPLALGRMTCCWRQLATEALSTAGRPFRLRLTSWNAAAITAAVLGGLAVSVLPESAVRPGMRILTEADGFPVLPPCDIALVQMQGKRSPHVDALADHILASLGNIHPPAIPPAIAAE